jgi:predicted AlkP superfamily pyrophosphatase or phosphodiesterase
MKKHVWLMICILPVITSFPQQPQQKNSSPKLIVGIVIDQMRYDYIFRYWNKFSNDGFKRLVNEGFFCKNTHYNYFPTYTGPGHASIYTGTTPSVHGIIANEWIDRWKEKEFYCSEDTREITLGSLSDAGKMSPRNMLVTSVCDELKTATAKQSKIIGIGLKDRGAILPAGHMANAAYWFDPGNISWISSTYYMKELPVWVIDFNRKEPVKKYLSQTWTTLLPIDQYTESTADDSPWEIAFTTEVKPVFPHNLPEIAKVTGMDIIRQTPFGNSFTKDFAIEAVTNENLGKGKTTDFLAVSFSSTDFIGHQFGPHSVETEDCYLRLDKDISAFLKFLDTWLGKNNVLIFLTADHGAMDAPGYLAENKIPSGTIMEKTFTDSLKKFSMRKFGDSLLVKTFTNFQLYLNTKLIVHKQMDQKTLEVIFAEYLLGMNGVADVVTASQISYGNFTDPFKKMAQNSFNRHRSGDVLVIPKPGWVADYKKGTTHGSPYTYDTHVPLIWWGWNIRQGSSSEEISIIDIAPTLSLLLNIPFPNGCTGKPIPSLVK